LGSGFRQNSKRYVLSLALVLLLMPDHAEANAPPMLNYGWVYPQALLIFTITLVYSVVSPLILVFGAGYFGVACEWLNRLLG
jgi:hypothetical protein